MTPNSAASPAPPAAAVAAPKAAPAQLVPLGRAGAGAVAAVFERKQFDRAVAGSVVASQDWHRLAELDALIAKVNDLYAQAGAEIEQAREQGHAAGVAQGIAHAKQQMTEQLASLNERRARVLREANGRISELACAIVARIAPQFDASQVVPRLVTQAVESAQAEQFLLIRIHPSVRDAVNEGLGAVRQAHPAVGVIELLDDVSLDPLSCVVVSEAGEVRAGVAQQIEAIRLALAGVAAGPA